MRARLALVVLATLALPDEAFAAEKWGPDVERGRRRPLFAIEDEHGRRGNQQD